MQTHRTKAGERHEYLNSFWKMVTYILLKLCLLAQPNREEIKVCVGSDRNENNRLQGFLFHFLKKLTQGGRRVKGKRKKVPKYHLSSYGCQMILQHCRHSCLLNQESYSRPQGLSWLKWVSRTFCSFSQWSYCFIRISSCSLNIQNRRQNRRNTESCLKTYHMIQAFRAADRAGRAQPPRTTHSLPPPKAEVQQRLRGGHHRAGCPCHGWGRTCSYFIWLEGKEIHALLSFRC